MIKQNKEIFPQIKSQDYRLWPGVLILPESEKQKRSEGENFIKKISESEARQSEFGEFAKRIQALFMAFIVSWLQIARDFFKFTQKNHDSGEYFSFKTYLRTRVAHFSGRSSDYVLSLSGGMFLPMQHIKNKNSKKKFFSQNLPKNLRGVVESLKCSAEWALSDTHKKSGVPGNCRKSEPP